LFRFDIKNEAKIELRSTFVLISLPLLLGDNNSIISNRLPLFEIVQMFAGFTKTKTQKGENAIHCAALCKVNSVGFFHLAQLFKIK
jgi:hypothetical protein